MSASHPYLVCVKQHEMHMLCILHMEDLPGSQFLYHLAAREQWNSVLQGETQAETLQVVDGGVGEVNSHPCLEALAKKTVGEESCIFWTSI